MVTWPELLGEQLGWPTVNVALPGSSSGTLATQTELLGYALERSGRTLHKDAWALVHAGGNDILQNSPAEILKLIWRLSCCCCCLTCGNDPVPVLEPQLRNVASLVTTLRDSFGVRNVMLVSMPLTVRMPIVSKYLELLLGQNAFIERLGGVVVRRLNRLYLHRLEKDSKRLNAGVNTVLLDEATAIDQLIERAAAAAAQREKMYGDVELHDAPARGRDGAFAIDDLGGAGAAHELLQRPEDLWRDPMHPSQRMHAALSVVLLEHFRWQSGVELPLGGSSAKGRAPPAGREQPYAPASVAARAETGSDSDPSEGLTVPLC